MPQNTTFGTATLANGMAFGPDGNLYVALTKAILRVTTAGIVTGTLDGGQSDLDPQSGLAAGTDGAIWFTEPSKDRVSRLTPDGTITHFSEGLEHGGPAHRPEPRRRRDAVVLRVQHRDRRARGHRPAARRDDRRWTSATAASACPGSRPPAARRPP